MTMISQLAALLLTAGFSRPGTPAPSTPGHSTRAAPAALSDEEVKTRAEAYLRALDTPIRTEQWQALGPRGAEYLRKIAFDAAEMPSRRARALQGLARTGNESDGMNAVALVERADAPYAIRLSALRASEHLLTAPALVQQLRPVLAGAPDARLKKTAAEILVRRAPEAGCAVVAEQAQQESDDAKSGALKKVLEKSCAAKR